MEDRGLLGTRVPQRRGRTTGTQPDPKGLGLAGQGRSVPTFILPPVPKDSQLPEKPFRLTTKALPRKTASGRSRTDLLIALKGKEGIGWQGMGESRRAASPLPKAHSNLPPGLAAEGEAGRGSPLRWAHVIV